MMMLCIGRRVRACTRFSEATKALASSYARPREKYRWSFSLFSSFSTDTVPHSMTVIDQLNIPTWLHGVMDAVSQKSSIR
jgi:hypothetical protein